MMKRLIATPLVVLVAGGCTPTPFSTFDPHGPQADWLATLGWWLVGLMSLIIITMGVLIVWGALRKRGNMSTHMPVDIDGGKRWILIGGVAVPVVVLSGLFIVTIVSLRSLSTDVAEPEIDIHVTAHRWWWDVAYTHDVPSQNFKSPYEVHIPVGEPVRIRLTSPDVIHSFWVPKLHGKLDVIPGHNNQLILEASEPGVYEGRCAEYCGVQHSHMRFVVIAHEPEDYDVWVAQQRQAASPPTEPLLLKGQEIFETYACAMCHTVRGTRAKGTVGPDLTHFGSRIRIAGFLPNNRARLQAWIVNAQALKPGVHMPTLDQFEGSELRALAAYLESLQ
jgi:cytochrome c oxidase subunit 2